MKAEGSKRIIPGQISDAGLPLFPLDLWLYPGVTLPLQIFEPRYLSMISKQLRCGAGFGIVPIRDGAEVGKIPAIHPVGVEVDVVDWYQQENGLLGIKVCGRQRFWIQETKIEAGQLLVGKVQYLPSEEQLPILDRHAGLSELLTELKQHPDVKALELQDPKTCNQLSYQLSQLLPFEASKKMVLMTASDAEQRLSIIAKQVFDMANV